MSSITALISNFQTDWSKCCLCQADKKGEELKTPPIHYSCSSDNDGYKMLAMNVPLFHEINQLPIIFDPKRLDEGDGIEQTLRKNKAQYHQSCRLLFNNTKLERARKRAASTPGPSEEVQTKMRRTTIGNPGVLSLRRGVSIS